MQKPNPLGMILPGYYAEESGYLSYSPLFDYAETTITGRWEDGKSDSLQEYFTTP